MSAQLKFVGAVVELYVLGPAALDKHAYRRRDVLVPQLYGFATYRELRRNSVARSEIAVVTDDFPIENDIFHLRTRANIVND